MTWRTKEGKKQEVKERKSWEENEEKDKRRRRREKQKEREIISWGE
jgi:hypothetical protein